MKSYHFIIFFVLISIFSCSSETEVVEEPTPVVVEKVEPKVVYDRLPANYVSILLTQSDALEGTFYESGKSVSLWDDNVKNVLAMMTEAAPISLDSKLVGHIMYLKEGEKLAYVEVFLSPSNSFVKYKVNEEIYYNRLTDQGKQFLGQMATAIPLVKKGAE